MKTKFIEILDSATFIPAQAWKIAGDESWLLKASGYGMNGYIFLMDLNKPHVERDPFQWTNRTMHHAHLWITNNWDLIENDYVVDVEFILGLNPIMKASQRMEMY